MKTITNNDVIKLEINSKEYMDIEITSEAKKTSTKFQLKLLDINENRIEVPDVMMSTITTLPSADFQRLCRDMSNLGTEIEIKRKVRCYISHVTLISPTKRLPSSAPKKVPSLQVFTV